MQEEKLLNLLKKEFGEDFYISTKNNNTEFSLICYLYDCALINFKIAQKYLLGALITETYPLMITELLPIIELETEEQVVQLIKTCYCYLQDKYKNVYQKRIHNKERNTIK